MFELNYKISVVIGADKAHMIYTPRKMATSPTHIKYASFIHRINEDKLYHLLIEETKYKQWNPSITLPPFSQMTFIRNLSIRNINITNDHIPAFPPQLLILNLYSTSIRVLDNLPDTLQFLGISINYNLVDIVLPPALLSFEASYQQCLKTITFPPTITYLRLYECSFTRLNRLTFEIIHQCTITRPFIASCIHPYTDVKIAEKIRPYIAEPQRIFECIQSINRQMDQDLTSVFYLLRKQSYHSTKQECPIMNAMILSSNPPRRFSEFIVE